LRLVPSDLSPSEPRTIRHLQQLAAARPQRGDPSPPPARAPGAPRSPFPKNVSGATYTECNPDSGLVA